MFMNKKINITFCIPQMIIGGVETVFFETLNELITDPDLNIKIITHAPTQEPLYINWLQAHPEIQTYYYYPLYNTFNKLEKYTNFFPLKQLRKITFSIYKKYRRLFTKLFYKHNDTDIFIDYNNFVFFKELKHIKKEKIAWIHSAFSYCIQNNLFSRLKNYDKIICITDEFLNEFKQRFPDQANKIIRIYNPIDPTTIQHKARLGKKTSEKYFSHVSRLANGKDLITVLKAFNIFAKKHKDTKLYIIGDGPLSTNIKAYANNLPCSNQIVFWGTLDNPFGLISGAIANILSSEHEGFGMVLPETMALSVPIISSNYKCGACEILKNGLYGDLFEIYDYITLAQHMEQIYNTPHNTLRLKSAYESLSRFEKTTITNQIKNLLKK